MRSPYGKKLGQYIRLGSRDLTSLQTGSDDPRGHSKSTRYCSWGRVGWGCAEIDSRTLKKTGCLSKVAKCPELEQEYNTQARRKSKKPGHRISLRGCNTPN